jgi:DNA (cytosine-5)-methyltransferase 1
MKELGSWIIDERVKRNLSQFKLAEILNVSNGKLSAWEMGKSAPSLADLDFIKDRLADFDDKLTKGQISLKKRFRAKKSTEPIETIKYLESKDWEKFKSPYDKSYLLGKSVNCQAKGSAPKAVALFAGCGGMSLGFKWAGFDVKGFIEIEDSARKIYKENFPNALELGTDILKLTDDQIKNWSNSIGAIDVLCGGPPCQGFSLAGKRDENDYRNKLYKEYQRIAEIVRPKAFALENVRVLTSMKDENGESVLENIIKGFDSIGYDTTYTVLNAANFGVPQSRERVIFIGVDKALNLAPSLPNETHSMENLVGPLKKSLTFKDACFDLDELEAGGKSKKDPLHWAIHHPEHVLEWLRITPEGKSAHENQDPNMRPPSGYNTTYKRLRWDEPSSTISTTFNMISGSRNVHPTSTRSLTIREAMRCQSFPDDFKIIGNWGDARKAIGNAVPPLLGEQLALHIKNHFLKK